MNSEQNKIYNNIIQRLTTVQTLDELPEIKKEISDFYYRYKEKTYDLWVFKINTKNKEILGFHDNLMKCFFVVQYGLKNHGVNVTNMVENNDNN